MRLKATVLHAPLLGSPHIQQTKKAATITILQKINNIAANILYTLLLSGAAYLFITKLAKYSLI